MALLSDLHWRGGRSSPRNPKADQLATEADEIRLGTFLRLLAATGCAETRPVRSDGRRSIQCPSVLRQ